MSAGRQTERRPGSEPHACALLDRPDQFVHIGWAYDRWMAGDGYGWILVTHCPWCGQHLADPAIDYTKASTE